MKFSPGKIAATSLLALAIGSANAGFDYHKGPYFNRVASFPIYENLDLNGGDQFEDETVAEIVSASTDGLTLIYTDSEKERIGFIDISNPSQPLPAGFVQLGGEPTSVTVKGPYALVGVNTSSDFVSPSGSLEVIDIASGTLIRSIDMGGQPDSTAVSPNGRYAAVVIENERDEDIVVGGVEGGLPQAPAGFLNIVDTVGAPANWQVRKVELTGLSDLAPEDPEPEFVDISRASMAVVSLQENNHLAVIHLPTGKVIKDFPAGEVSLSEIDIFEEDVIDPTGTLEDIPREPDAVTWLNARYFATANEGDLNGGSRGFSIFRRMGLLAYDSGNRFEHTAIRHGHYPEGRSENKGSEPEGIESARFGWNRFLFVASERGNFVSVYKANRARKPKFHQVLPTGVGPEGLLAIPKRKLFVVASEKDDAGDGFRSLISIYKLQHKMPTYPGIKSTEHDLIPWGALSGLAADRKDRRTLYSVHDSFYKESKIFTIDASKKPAVITRDTLLLKDGNTVDYDLEGIAQAADGSFWLASEGKPGKSKNLLIHSAADGTVMAEYELPAAVQANMKKHGFEGVTVRGTGAASEIYVAFQREWDSDPDQHVRIGVFTPADGTWKFFYYPIEAAPTGWVGLSEITALRNGHMAVIERDNQQGPLAAIKRIYTFDPASVTAKPEGETFDVVSKTLVNDLLDELQVTNGWTPDKVEGLAVVGKKAYIVTDNDGLDDAVGETLFFKTRLAD